MWRSVPHTPARSTRSRISPAPTDGTGTSRISSPGPACALTTAFMVAAREAPGVRNVSLVAVEGFIERILAGFRYRRGRKRVYGRRRMRLSPRDVTAGVDGFPSNGTARGPARASLIDAERC